MTFSSRTPFDLSQNPIAEAIARSKKTSILDLTESNPTKCGFHYPAGLFQSLNKPQTLVYEPDPFGSIKARQAVADYLGTKGQVVDPSHLLLTASTSEAYSYLFKLLGNPEDSFLVPTPGYPLLDHLIRLEAMKLLPYPLRMTAGWPVDVSQTQKTIQPKTKGLIVINPHNPTGCFLSLSDQKKLLGLCKRYKMSFISDEVFSDFAYSGEFSQVSPSIDVLSFRLGGLSKSLGLPQLKLAWIVMEGPNSLLKECVERLELIADTYLSVNTPVQLALGDLLQFAPLFQKQVLDRVLENRVVLEKSLKGIPHVKVWPAEGGWYALTEISKHSLQDEKIVLDLLEKYQVLVQPGGFYDFPKRCFLVLSLLSKKEVFEAGSQRLGQYLAGI